MSCIAIVNGLKGRHVSAIAAGAGLIMVACGLAFAAQDRYSLKLGKLSFGDFRGYENQGD